MLAFMHHEINSVWRERRDGRRQPHLPVRARQRRAVYGWAVCGPEYNTPTNPAHASKALAAAWPLDDFDPLHSFPFFSVSSFRLASDLRRGRPHAHPKTQGLRGRHPAEQPRTHVSVSMRLGPAGQWLVITMSWRMNEETRDRILLTNAPAQPSSPKPKPTLTLSCTGTSGQFGPEGRGLSFAVSPTPIPHSAGHSSESQRQRHSLTDQINQTRCDYDSTAGERGGEGGAAYVRAHNGITGNIATSRTYTQSHTRMLTHEPTNQRSSRRLVTWLTYLAT